jgi:hypothetical protein
MNAPRVPMNWLPILAICVIALSTRGGSAWDGEEPAAGGVSRGKHRLEYALWSDGLNGSTSDGIPLRRRGWRHRPKPGRLIMRGF